MEKLLGIIEELSVLYHQSARNCIYERSGDIYHDLIKLRLKIDTLRKEAGLGPSPVEPTWEGEEDEDRDA